MFFKAYAIMWKPLQFFILRIYTEKIDWKLIIQTIVCDIIFDCRLCWDIFWRWLLSILVRIVLERCQNTRISMSSMLYERVGLYTKCLATSSYHFPSHRITKETASFIFIWNTSRLSTVRYLFYSQIAISTTRRSEP